MTALTYGFDLNYGSHGFNVSVQAADDEESDLGGSYYNDVNRVAVGDVREADLDDFSVAYTYRFNKNWVGSIGYNSTSSNYTYSNISPYEGYQWNDSETGETERTGYTFLAGYNTPISNNVIFTAKIGWITSDLEESSSGLATISGFSAEIDEVLNINGDGFSYSNSVEGDSDAVVLGLGFVWLVAPKNQIRLDFTLRSLDYDLNPGEYVENVLPGGYFEQAGYGEYSETIEQTSEITDDFWYTTLSWRYALN